MLPVLAIPLLMASSLSVSTQVAAFDPSTIKGLNPEKYSLYKPSAQKTFTCLTGSKKVISWNAVNDDYCDCEDGSDEPGTSACRNSTFYCANVGHLPGVILSSRVGDGICDPECCDGSDEAPGVCENRCGEIGKEFRAARDAEAKIRKTGAKIRSSYIAFAQKRKVQLEQELEKLVEDVSKKEAEVKQAEKVVETSEAEEGATKEKRRASPLFQSLLNHRSILSALQTRTARAETELEQLKGIMEEFVRSYNPNYQDMAVRAAAKGYMELFHDGRTPPAEGTGEGETEIKKEAVEEELGSQAVTDQDLEELEKLDLEGLLVGWDDGTTASSFSSSSFASLAEDSILYNIGNYIPDPFVESYEFLRGSFVEWLIKLGVVEPTDVKAKAKSSASTASSPSREKLTVAQTALTNLQSSLSNTQSTLSDLTAKFGPQGEWKKLEGTCIEKNLGEYTYELCFFGEAKQKSNKGGSVNSLGRFKQWNYDSKATEGTEGFYQKQLYDMGAKCWNGPHRSVKLEMTCARENELLSVMELEKCEYLFKGTSPALCWPETEAEGGGGSGSEVEDVKEKDEDEAKVEVGIKHEREL
ncbi:Protein kinase C substrate, 80 KD protein, heavy chain [Phaffia rhodozyma]|uniref:Glucosidase 2 subunit beta n=1 Tax=Phaffia rhodozyma TaxID=264483 RepID=A0A0F7SVF7_PHARH|nr:Protein kinase C substrate, 80 KD protein, heavy chain [Phaffia rhodozyma]